TAVRRDHLPPAPSCGGARPLAREPRNTGGHAPRTAGALRAWIGFSYGQLTVNMAPPKRRSFMPGKSTPGKLILVRHGQSTWNVENLFTGWHDVDLSEQGRREAADAAKQLLDEKLNIDLCFTSVLKRAIRTLWIIMDGMDRMWLPVERSWRLNERHYGALQGLNKAQTVEKHGEAQVK